MGTAAERRPQFARRSLAGFRSVARFLLGLVRQARGNRLTIDAAWVNGQPGAQVRDEQGRILSVFALDIAGEHIRAVHNVLNPDKLRHLS